MVSVCAIIAGNYLPYARVLADSFFEQHPTGSLTVLIVDDEERRLDPADSRIEWRRLSDIGLDRREIHRLAGIYDVTELSTAVKPRLLRTLLDEGRQEVIFLDPDIRLFAPLDDVIPLARRHGFVLTPHTTVPYPKDGRQIDGRFVLASGVYNLGFIAIGANARPFLDWWEEATRREALIDFPRMLFTDQRWIDYAPSLFDPYILKDPGYNVAYWNLHARDVKLEGGRYVVGDLPLRFFHFSGFDVRKPWLLSRHQGDRPRVLLSERPVIARLCREYLASLERAGLDPEEMAPYGWQTAAGGFALTPRMRRLYWHGLVAAEENRTPEREPADPFDSEHPGAFLDWLNTPDDDGPPRVSRFLYSIYRDRADLQLCFPDLHGQDAARYADWVWRYGVEQEPALFDLFELLPPRDCDEVELAEPGRGYTARRAHDAVTIAGPLQSSSMMGEAARLLASAVEAARIPLSTIASDDGGLRVSDDGGLRVTVAGRPIGYWLWHVGPLPASMHRALDDVDELWAPTDYVAEILRAAGRGKPVFTVPLPMPVPVAPPEITRECLGLPDRFIFLARVDLDLANAIARENPLGAIAAFSAAFAPDAGPLLAIEIVNGDRQLPELERLRMAARARRDVLLLERPFSVDEQHALVSICDCVVSLHRADAMGLAIAKAMAVGKPAIATGYSGNLHFMTSENSYLVDYTLSLVPAGCEACPPGACWAQPDLDHAALLMREVYDRPFDAACRARRGQADVFERHGLWTAASALVERVEEIRREQRLRVGAPIAQPEPPAPPTVEPAPVQAPPVQAPSVQPPPVQPPPVEPPAHVQNGVPEEGVPATQEAGASDHPEQRSTPPAVSALEALVPHLEQLGAPRLSAEGRALRHVRLAAQRALFRAIQPYWFQQRQFQQALIGALRSSVKTLSGEVGALSGELSTLRAEVRALRAQAAVHRADSEASRVQTDARIDALTAEDTQARASLAALSERLFATPFDPGRERFLQQAPNGDTRLGYEFASPNGAYHSAEPLFRARQRMYLPLLKPRVRAGGSARVLDIGCGRGAMLDLLRVARVPAVGIDFDPAMVSHCRANGHVVEQADPLQFLRTQPEASVPAIFSARLIEHLSFEQLQEFLRLCRRRLEQGGLLIAETANPRQPAVPEPRLARSAPGPISPEVALALCQHAGFEQAHVLFPTGTGALDPDRHAQPHYAVVATAGSGL